MKWTKVGELFTLNKGHQRSILAKKNILASIIIRVANIGINFLYVPILLDYLGQEEYGVWLTVSSVVLWFGFFDIGLGQGLRNKLTVALANKDHKLAKQYISTTYFMLSIVSVFFIVIICIIAPLINWNGLFNTNTIESGTMQKVVLTVFIGFFLRFTFQIVGIILLSLQKPAINNFINLLINFATLLVIYILISIDYKGGLFEFSLVLSVVPVVVFFLTTLLLFRGHLSFLRPSFSFINFRLNADLLGLGSIFFLITIADVVMYSTTNYLISTFVGPSEVVVYNVAFKVFSASTMLFSIVLTPMWSAFTEAYSVGDFSWIKRSVRKIQILGLIMSLGVVVLLILSPKVYSLWLGDKVVIPFSMSLVIAFSSILKLIFSVFVSFQNGIGRIKTVMYLSLISATLYIPAAYLLAVKLNFGAIGIILASIIVEIPTRIQQVLLYIKVVNNKHLARWTQ